MYCFLFLFFVFLFFEWSADFRVVDRRLREVSQQQKTLVARSFTGADQDVNKWKSGETGRFFKGIGNKLNCVLQLSVQKHFHALLFILFQTCAALQRPHWTEKENGRFKRYFKYLFFSFFPTLFLKTKCTYSCKYGALSLYLEQQSEPFGA